jgi:hypothetical protein
MDDRAAFAKLVDALAPWADQLVFVGGWAHRLYRLHPKASVPSYQPLTTLDADVAFAEREQLQGNIQERLIAAGFKEELTGQHQPPVSRYTLGEEGSGFYAEFLTPLIGRSTTKSGKQLATVAKAGVTAQQLRYLELLFRSPWLVTLTDEWSAAPLQLRIPNPVSFIVQKLLIHDDRAPGKKAQDLLYIRDTLELFAPELDTLAVIWREEVQVAMDEKWVQRMRQTIVTVFGKLNDTVRDAASIPQDRDLDPEQMRAMCHAALGEMLE